MSKSRSAWTASLLILVLCETAYLKGQEVLTFDDLPASGNNPIPNGYDGLDWSNYHAEDPRSIGVGNGYIVGVISPHNVAYNGDGKPADIQAINGIPFTFVGAYLTAAWNDGLSVEVQGYRNGALQYDTTVVPSAVHPTFFTFNYVSVDDLHFSSFGGTVHQGYMPSLLPAEEFAMDNLTIVNPAPEPSSIALLAIGVVGIVSLLILNRRLSGKRLSK